MTTRRKFTLIGLALAFLCMPMPVEEVIHTLPPEQRIYALTHEVFERINSEAKSDRKTLEIVSQLIRSQLALTGYQRRKARNLAAKYGVSLTKLDANDLRRLINQLAPVPSDQFEAVFWLNYQLPPGCRRNCEAWLHKTMSTVARSTLIEANIPMAQPIMAERSFKTSTSPPRAIFDGH